MTLSDTTTPDQSEPGSNSNEKMLHIPQSFSITAASPSDFLVLYPRHSMGVSHSSVEVQSVYSKAAADWARISIDFVYTQLNVKTFLLQTIPFSIQKPFQMKQFSLA